jgi:hypothetical protein
MPIPLSKVYSQRAADELRRLGWTLKHQFRAAGDAEPYEYIFAWEKDGEPVRMSKDPNDWGHIPPSDQ